jgi:hypothetical protein
MDQPPGPVRGQGHRERAAPPTDGEGPGVAVGEDPRPGRDQVQTVLGHRGAGGVLLGGEGGGGRDRRRGVPTGRLPGGEDPGDPGREVDRGRAGRRQRVRRGRHVVAARGRERDAVRARNPQQRRAPDGELTDRRDEGGDVAAHPLDLQGRQARLVQQHHGGRGGIPAERGGGAHGCRS